jgi:hypothetical protein
MSIFELFEDILKREGVTMLKQLLQNVSATIAISVLAASQALAATPVETEVLAVDEAYRVAKLHQDLTSLDKILADPFNETNQNGNSRNKAQTLELWKEFSIASLTTDTSEVRVTGDTAVVLGTQTENGSERMLFTRVYQRVPGGWRLLSSIQFRNPRTAQAAPAAAAAADVMAVEEAFRLAKLRQDTASLGRILADAFIGTNQNGNTRNKAQMLELWKSFSVSSLITDTSEVRLSGDTAMALGTQTENGTEHMLFTRIYVKRLNKWELLSSMQFRNPKMPDGSVVADASLR